MLWAMFWWVTSGPGIHVDVTIIRTTSINIVTDHVHPPMQTVFPDGFQQDNVLCHKTKIVEEWFEKQRI